MGALGAVVDVDRFDRELAELAEQIRERREQVAHAREMLSLAIRALDMLEQDQREIRRRRDRVLVAPTSQGHNDRGSCTVTVSHAALAGASGGRRSPPVGGGRAEDATPPAAVPLPERKRHVWLSSPAGAEGRRLRPDPKGRAPRGFTREVRRIAHRSIAQAGRSLNRRAIMDDLERSEVPMPVKNAAQKVSKILGRDPDLLSKRGGGYTLVPEALARELAALAAGTEPTLTADP